MNSEFKLEDYLSGGIENIIKGALKASLKNPKESLFIAKFALAAKEAAATRSRYEAAATHIPAFLICSITDRCNLNCKGCYSRANHLQRAHNKEQLDVREWQRIFTEASELGVSFILLAGGEPMMRLEVIEAAADVKKIMFPVFTNGTQFNQQNLKLFDQHRNLLPIISIEGEAAYTDSRRGAGVHTMLETVMQDMKDRGIFYGVSITVTKENLNNITEDDFLSKIYQSGCKIIFYVEYVPVSATTENLALSEEDRDKLDNKLQQIRLQYNDMLILSFPGDEKSSGGCLAAGRGFFHINSDGSAEPCPFSPYSDTNIKDCTLLEALQSPLFRKLAAENILMREHKGGCVLFEQAEEVKRISNN
ncbi:MAG TPA: radical SAM protein [Mobilitalea sp.]|nr:radical SAM protein [Mobilitalea sp.]